MFLRVFACSFPFCRACTGTLAVAPAVIYAPPSSKVLALSVSAGCHRRRWRRWASGLCAWARHRDQPEIVVFACTFARSPLPPALGFLYMARVSRNGDSGVSARTEDVEKWTAMLTLYGIPGDLFSRPAVACLD